MDTTTFSEKLLMRTTAHAKQAAREYSERLHPGEVEAEAIWSDWWVDWIQENTIPLDIAEQCCLAHRHAFFTLSAYPAQNTSSSGGLVELKQ